MRLAYWLVLDEHHRDQTQGKRQSTDAVSRYTYADRPRTRAAVNQCVKVGDNNIKRRRTDLERLRDPRRAASVTLRPTSSGEGGRRRRGGGGSSQHRV